MQCRFGTWGSEGEFPRPFHSVSEHPQIELRIHSSRPRSSLYAIRDAFIPSHISSVHPHKQRLASFCSFKSLEAVKEMPTHSEAPAEEKYILLVHRPRDHRKESLAIKPPVLKRRYPLAVPQRRGYSVISIKAESSCIPRRRNRYAERLKESV
ncbi:hypothetical protein BU26DRAFT_155780 [Trematosphaeria pertusa]|uniref:Uncharacterized protein n=1 Tax=Trematosphaeria pertusa TaxID=390896 RepID=A0A6A6IYN4_9PLEO|nr:uncharacterized protein BU26DRAFT_155780 [Trematosphaeria pertusa]KAF2255418.1 hypothetical protein BU26DRAFT_155780 [Trematosphaeria pertusa]